MRRVMAVWVDGGWGWCVDSWRMGLEKRVEIECWECEEDVGSPLGAMGIDTVGAWGVALSSYVYRI